MSGSGDETIRIWDAESDRVVSWRHSGFVFSVSFSPDGRRIVSGSGDKTIRIWDAEWDRVVEAGGAFWFCILC